MAEFEDTTTEEEYNDDGTKNPNYIAPKTESEGEPSNTEKEEGEGDGEEGEGNKDEFDDTAEPEIPVRQSNAQFIIARKNKQIEKLRSKQNEVDETEDNLDDDLAGGDKESIGREIDSRIAPIIESLATKADEDEMKALFANDPEAKKYEKHIRAYMTHDSYKGVPPSVIYHHLAFNNVQAIGAKKKRVADFEANQNKSGGRVIPPKENLSNIPTAEEIAEMSENEFDKMESEARQGKFIGR